MKMILLLSTLLTFAPDVFAKTEWYCKPGLFADYSRIEGLICSEQGQGQLYCRNNSSDPIGKCGSFSTISGHLVGAIMTNKGPENRKLAPVRDRPATLNETQAVSETTGGKSSTATVTRNVQRGSSGLNNDFPPRQAKFSRSRSTSVGYTNTSWLAMSTVQQAQYLMGKYKTLAGLHGLRFSPELLTCKAYRESLLNLGGRKIFQVQRITSVKSSTAAGVSQVTKTTARDTFARGRWFRSKVPGFEGITDGTTFYNQMAGNMIAQMEFGMAILEQKRRDGGFRSDHSVLQAYYGHPKKSCQKNYADKVTSCTNCLKSSGVSVRCLDRALGGC